MRLAEGLDVFLRFKPLSTLIRSVKKGLFYFGKVLHQLKLLVVRLVLLARVPLWICGLPLLVDPLALPLQTFLVLSLLVIDILLEATMHLESRVEPVLNCVISSARHVLCNKRPLLPVSQEQIHQAFVLVQSPFVFSDIWV